MRLEGDVMRMKAVEGGLEIKPGATVELKPGGLHLMFMDLKEPLKEGQTVKGTLDLREGRSRRGGIHRARHGRGCSRRAQALTEAAAMNIETSFSCRSSSSRGAPGARRHGGPAALSVAAAAERRQACRSAGRSGSPSHEGKPFTEENLKGKPFVVFFGFTHCPEVCPTTLYDLTQDMAALGKDASSLQAAFITVDPERDTPELMKTYLSSFDPRIVGLTGTEEEIAAAARPTRSITARCRPMAATPWTIRRRCS